MADIVETKPKITARPRGKRRCFSHEYPEYPELPFEHLAYWDTEELRELDFDNETHLYRVLSRMR
jgi:hypothetical protein